MPARRFFIHRSEAVFFQQVERAFGRAQQEIFFAGGKPEQLQPFFQIGVVEFGLVQST